LIRKRTAALASAILMSPLIGQSDVSQTWVATSNGYTNMLLAIVMEHHPEVGSDQGLSKYDRRVSQPTLADEDKERAETAAVLSKLKAAAVQPQQKEVAQDLQILIRKVDLQFREQDFERAHKVEFLNASEDVFRGLRILLDEQTGSDRRPAAVTRIREYAGLESGYEPIADILKHRVMEQMAKPGVFYPARVEIETELARNSNYLDGIASLMRKYNLTGWQEPYEKLKSQLKDYDAWTIANVLPKARADFRLPPEEYALALENYGIDIPPGQLAIIAHEAFRDMQEEMKPIAAQIAKQRSLPSADYRDVIRELKKQQLVGDAILPFYQDRLKQIEKIIVDHEIVTLPDRPARIRIATAAETAQQPAPHMVPPPFLHNTGQKGEFVLPLNIPAGPGQSAAEKYDDFTFDAAAWTLTAHEARPGHELQFDSMLERGVSLARVTLSTAPTSKAGDSTRSTSSSPICLWKVNWSPWITACCARRGRSWIPSCNREKSSQPRPSACWRRTSCNPPRLRRRKWSVTHTGRRARRIATSTAIRS
jgi:uncharacterized protein (DUF885 family)